MFFSKGPSTCNLKFTQDLRTIMHNLNLETYLYCGKHHHTFWDVVLVFVISNFENTQHII
jgi:hypothetical protein